MKRLFFIILVISAAFAFADEKKSTVSLISVSLTTTETKKFSKLLETPRLNGGKVGTVCNAVEEKLPDLYRRIKIKMQLSGDFSDPEISKIQIDPVKTGGKRKLRFHAFGFGQKPIIVANSDFFTYQIKKIDKITGHIDVDETKEQELTIDKLKEKIGKNIELPQLGKMNAKIRFSENSSGSLEITILTSSDSKPNLVYEVGNLKSAGKNGEPLKAIGFLGMPTGTIHNMYDKGKKEKIIFCYDTSVAMGEESKGGKNSFFRKIRTNIAMSSLTDKTFFKMKVAVPEKTTIIPFCFENIELP